MYRRQGYQKTMVLTMVSMFAAALAIAFRFVLPWMRKERAIVIFDNHIWKSLDLCFIPLFSSAFRSNGLYMFLAGWLVLRFASAAL
jgi:hypothetical protein